MVCVAAFIILCLVSVFVAVLSIFRRDIGKKYWKTFKKAWGCVGKRLTLQKCETNFKEDVKNSILKKVIIKKPKLVKPISVGIEVAAVLIVIVTIWSLVEAAKAGLAIYALGSCTVNQPESCIINSSAESCTVQRNLNWFEEWGFIFAAIPDRTKNWNVNNYLPRTVIHYHTTSSHHPALVQPRPLALDVFDPGCVFCLQSYVNKKSSGFFDKYDVIIFPYVTRMADGTDRFANSEIITRYLIASATLEPLTQYGLDPPPFHTSTPGLILEKLFTEYGVDAVGTEVIYQALFNDHYSAEEAKNTLKGWLIEFGYSEQDVEEVATLAHSDAMSEEIDHNRKIAEERIRISNIPTVIYDGRKRSGLFKYD
jgi:hypothetical protein